MFSHRESFVGSEFVFRVADFSSGEENIYCHVFVFVEFGLCDPNFRELCITYPFLIYFNSFHKLSLTCL
jgi:hypothetical protein